MKNISLLALAFLLLLFSPLLFSASQVVYPQAQPNMGAYQQQQSITDGIQYADNVKLIKMLKEQQNLLISANNHIMKLYQYLEKRNASS